MTFRKAAMALAMTFLATSAANAAIMTRTYTSVATYDRGPLPTVSVTATVTFDPFVENSASLISLTGSDGAIFANPQFQYFVADAFAGFVIGGGPEGPQGMFYQNNDFDWFFALDKAGEVVLPGFLNYSKVGGEQIYESSSIVTTGNVVSSAVPEPATWALMILGFGAVGVAMRRRTAVKPSVRFA